MVFATAVQALVAWKVRAWFTLGGGFTRRVGLGFGLAAGSCKSVIGCEVGVAADGAARVVGFA